MVLHRGSESVRRGLYVPLGRGKSIDVIEGGMLPGDAAARYLRIPMSFMLVAGPIVGLLYVLLVPFLWTAAAVVIIAGRIAGGLITVSAKSGSFGWRPIEAYLAGRRDRKRRRQESGPKAPK